MISKYLRQRIQIVFSVPSFAIFLFSFHFHPPSPFFSLLVAYFLEFLPKSSLNPPLCPIELNFNIPSPPGEGGGEDLYSPLWRTDGWREILTNRLLFGHLVDIQHAEQSHKTPERPDVVSTRRFSHKPKEASGYVHNFTVASRDEKTQNFGVK